MADIYGSEPERIVFGWLTENDIQFNFQLPLVGGSIVAGGIMVDFFITGVGGPPICLFVNSYWHTFPEKRELDYIQQHIIESLFGYRVEEIWERDIRDWGRLNACMWEILIGYRPPVSDYGPSGVRYALLPVGRNADFPSHGRQPWRCFDKSPVAWYRE